MAFLDPLPDLQPPPAWLQPVSPDAPAGAAPGDEALAALERQLRVQAASATASGPGADHDRDPDWSQARHACAAWCQSTRDLRAAVGWARASLSTHGLAGLAAGLQLIAHWLQSMWTTVHPVIDAVEDPEGLERRHLLLNLAPDAARSQPTPEGESLARALRAARVGVNAQREPLAVRQLDHDTLAWDAEAAATARAAHASLAALQAIDQAFLRETGQGLRLPGLQRVLERVARAADGAAPQQDGASSQATRTGAEAEAACTAGLAAASLQALAGASRAPASRAEAARQLLALSAWVRHHEPSSPAPLLVERAAALLQMDFADIVRTLLPAARSQVEAIAGVPLDPHPR